MVFGALLGLGLGVLPAGAQDPLPLVDGAGGRAPTAAQTGLVNVFVQFSGEPAARTYARQLQQVSARSSDPQEARQIGARAAEVQSLSNRAQQETAIEALRSAQISYTELYRASRAMNGVALSVPRNQLDSLKSLPGVVAVRPLQPSVPHSNSSVSFINSGQVWNAVPGLKADGTGVRIGIIDTGIDYVHSHFGGSGLLADYQAINTRTTSNGGPSYFPTAKVVGGVDLAGDAYDANVPGSLPNPDPNPMDCYGHGTHVAGTAAGYGVTSSGATFTGPYDNALPSDLRIQPGVAPKASLYAIRVFGCSGSTNLVVQAIDWALDPNQDSNLSDHLDVINMSLGSDAGGLSALDTEAAENAAAMGVVVVASAGNSGDTYMVLGSPSVSRRTISVAASLDAGEQIGMLTIASPALIVGSYQAVPAGFGPPLPSSPPVQTLVMASPVDACSALTNAGAVAGKLAVVNRGTCSFDVKANFAQAAGAIGVIVVNNVGGGAFSMGASGTQPNPTIPAAMISLADGNLIEAQLASPGVTGSLGAVPGGMADTLASFSSRGPNNGMPLGLKPDLTAPGANIVSAQTGVTFNGSSFVYKDGNLSATMSGTSMAAPHVAGMMALLRQLHPTWTVEQLKAAAVNGAAHDVTTLPAGGGLRYGAGRVGAGRIDAELSAQATVQAYNATETGAVSLSFPGEVFGVVTVDKQLRIDNTGPTAANLTLAVDTVVDNPGIEFQLPAGNSLSVPAGGSVLLTVRMRGDAALIRHTRDATVDSQQSTSAGTFDRSWLTEETANLLITVGGSGTPLRVPLYVAPYAASSMTGGPVLATGGAASGSGSVVLAGTPACTGSLSGSVCTQGSDDVVSHVSPLELQVRKPRNPARSDWLDVRYAGIATDGSNLIFGLSTWGAWGQPSLFALDYEITLYDSLGTARYVLYPTQLSTSGGDPTNVYGTGILNLTTNGRAFVRGGNLTLAKTETRLFQNEVLLLGVPLSALSNLGLGAGGTVRYGINTFDANGVLADSITGLHFNMGAQGVDFGGQYLFEDLPGVGLPLNWNVANLQSNASLGVLLLHHHNKIGTTAEVLALPGTLSASAGSGQSTAVNTAFATALKVHVVDVLGNPISGVTVSFSLPASGASGTFSGGGTTASVLSDSAGDATAPAITANAVTGSYSVSASASGFGTPASFTLSNVQTAVSGTVSGGGTAQASVAGLWQFAPAGNGVNQTAGFIPLTGHPKSPATPPPAGWSFPNGLFDFVLQGGTSGSQAVVTINYPAPIPTGARYWKYGATSDNAVPHWYQFAGAVISGSTVTLTLTDGGAGDHDRSSNGTIVDPGGWAIPNSDVSEAQPIPTLSWSGLLVLLGAMGLAGLAGLRRRA